MIFAFFLNECEGVIHTPYRTPYKICVCLEGKYCVYGRRGCCACRSGRFIRGKDLSCYIILPKLRREYRYGTGILRLYRREGGCRIWHFVPVPVLRPGCSVRVRSLGGSTRGIAAAAASVGSSGLLVV